MRFNGMDPAEGDDLAATIYTPMLRGLRDEIYDDYIASPGLVFRHAIRARVGAPFTEADSTEWWKGYAVQFDKDLRDRDTSWIISSRRVQEEPEPLIPLIWGTMQRARPLRPFDWCYFGPPGSTRALGRFLQQLDEIPIAYGGQRRRAFGVGVLDEEVGPPMPEEPYIQDQLGPMLCYRAATRRLYRHPFMVEHLGWPDDPDACPRDVNGEVVDNPFDPFRGPGFDAWEAGADIPPGTYSSHLTRDIRICVVRTIDYILGLRYDRGGDGGGKAAVPEGSSDPPPATTKGGGPAGIAPGRVNLEERKVTWRGVTTEVDREAAAFAFETWRSFPGRVTFDTMKGRHSFSAGANQTTLKKRLLKLTGVPIDGKPRVGFLWPRSEQRTGPRTTN